jgi:hypothetical protein
MRVQPCAQVIQRLEIQQGFSEFRQRFERQSVQPLLDVLGYRSTDPRHLPQKNCCPPSLPFPPCFGDAFHRCDVRHVQTLLQSDQIFFEFPAQVLRHRSIRTTRQLSEALKGSGTETNRVITAAMILRAAKFDRLSLWKKGRPMIDILLLSTTVFVVAVVMLVFPPPTATSSY